jgi:glutamate-5-semialdehyde dehydrogenase
MKDSDDIHALMATIGARAQAAAADLAFAAPRRSGRPSTPQPTPSSPRAISIVAANARDMDFGRDKGLAPAMLDRLRLDDARLDGIAARAARGGRAARSGGRRSWRSGTGLRA